MAKRKRRSPSWPRRILLGLAAIPVAYLVAALIGSLIPVNSSWREPEQGITIYLADNGLHADLVLPVRAAGLDWAPLVPRGDMADARPDMKWIAFGAGERRVYLDTPTWADISPRTAWAALTGGERVIHAEYTSRPDLCGARDPPHARAISPPVGVDPRRVRARPRRSPGAHRPSRLRPARRLLRRHRPGKRAVDVQQLGRRAACGWRGSRRRCGRRSRRGCCGATAKSDATLTEKAGMAAIGRFVLSPSYRRKHDHHPAVAKAPVARPPWPEPGQCRARRGA